MEKHRDVCNGDGFGNTRHKRYRDAFDWVQHSIEAGFFLEAIAILDSLIWDRLSSRLGHLKRTEVSIKKTCGMVCNELIGAEKDRAFQVAIRDIKLWIDKRNDSMHATAKAFREDPSKMDFSTALRSHKQTAIDGVTYLRAFDALDTESRATAGKIPASYPFAFSPDLRPGNSRISRQPPTG